MVEQDELKRMGLKGLLKELGEARTELFKITFEVRTGQNKANHKIKQLKKYIARVLTIMNKRREEFEKEEKQQSSNPKKK